MKVLHINSYFSANSFYKFLYDNQKEHGGDINVYVPVSQRVEHKNYLNEDYILVSACYNYYDRFIFHLKHLKILKDIECKYDISQYNILHAHSLFSNGYIAYKLNKKYGIPYVVAIRDTDVNCFFKKMVHLKKLGLEIMRNAEQIIFLSKTYKDEVISNYVLGKDKLSFEKKSKIIPNGVDNFWHENINYNVGKKDFENQIRIVFVGDISKRKNPIMTAEACKVLVEKGFKVKFTLVGDIKDQKQFKKLKEYEFVSYVSRVNKQELINILRDNDIFIMPSITETFGLVYAEAMSQGLPVIYSKGQGFDEQFLEGEVGFHVNPLDKNDIVNKVINIMADYDCISRKCLENISKFDWGKIAKKYFNIYYDISN